MKLKTTKKQIRENTFNNLIAIGYCGAQSLLRHKQPFAYSTGVYGWACDYYQIDINGRRTIISTGYSPIGEHIDYKTLDKYEQKAEKIRSNYELKYGNQDKKVNKLLEKLIGEFYEQQEREGK